MEVEKKKPDNFLRVADDCKLKAQDSYHTLARKSTQFLESSGEKVKDATSHVGQCTIKAMAIPAIVILDILGFFFQRPEESKGKTKASIKKGQERVKKSVKKAAKDAKTSAKHFGECTVQALILPAVVLFDMVGSIFGR